MFNVLRERLQQGYRTAGLSRRAGAAAARAVSRPADARLSPSARRAATSARSACPTDAIQLHDGQLAARHGALPVLHDCLGGLSGRRDPIHAAIIVSPSRTREGLVRTDGDFEQLAAALDETAQRLFGRSLKLRQVSAGGCNACEADVNVLNTVVFDLSRFGIQFVASPRHADGLLITGPVTENMRIALQKTYDAVPAPKLVIAVGAVPFRADRTSTTRRPTTAPTASCRSICTSPAVHPVPGQFWTACCGYWAVLAIMNAALFLRPLGSVSSPSLMPSSVRKA